MTHTESSAGSPGGTPNTDADVDHAEVDAQDVDHAKVDAQDVVAWCGQVEDQARRVLASGGPDGELARAIERALAQVDADRANGESAYNRILSLQQLLDRDELRRG